MCVVLMFYAGASQRHYLLSSGSEKTFRQLTATYPPARRGGGLLYRLSKVGEKGEKRFLGSGGGG